MRYKYFEYFDTLVKAGSMSKAAKLLHVVQPALSRCIRKQEEDFGVTLIDRNKRPLKLTAEGRIYYSHVKTILQQIDDLKQDLLGLSKGCKRVLRIALSDDIHIIKILDLLTLYREEEPEVDIQLTEVGFTDLFIGLKNGNYDVGFCQYLIEDQNISIGATWEEPLIVALPKRHPLLSCQNIELDILLQNPLILYHPHHFEGTYKQVQKILLKQDRHTKPAVIKYSKSWEVMLSLISAGFGLGLIPKGRQDFAHRYYNVSTRCLKLPPMINTYMLHSVTLNDTLEKFICRVNTTIINQISTQVHKF